MYDRPAEDFKKTSIEDKHKILLKLSKDYDTFVPDKRFDQITISNSSFFLKLKETYLRSPQIVSCSLH